MTAGLEQGAWAVTPLLQPLVQHGARVVLHGHEVAELAALHLHAGEALVGALVVVELQDPGDAQARAEQHRQQWVVTQALLRART